MFRARPDQVDKAGVEISKAAGKAWHSLSQEEKEVSLLFPSGLCLSVIDVGTSPSNMDISPPNQLLARKTPKVPEPSGSSSILDYSLGSFCLRTLPRSLTLLP